MPEAVVETQAMSSSAPHRPEAVEDALRATRPGPGMTSAWPPASGGHSPDVAGRNGVAVAVDQPEPRPGSQGGLTRTEAVTIPRGCRPGSGVAVRCRRARPDPPGRTGTRPPGRWLT